MVHDLDANRLLFDTAGRDYMTVIDFTADLNFHGGSPEAVQHVCQKMSAAYAKWVGLALTNAAIRYDPSHVVAMAVDAMDKVRKAEMRGRSPSGGPNAWHSLSHDHRGADLWNAQKPSKLVNQAARATACNDP